MADDLQPNGWTAAVALAIVGVFREGYRFLTKDRDANMDAMSQRIREIETREYDCAKANAQLQFQVGTLQADQRNITADLKACEEKHADAESRIASLEASLGQR